MHWSHPQHYREGSIGVESTEETKERETEAVMGASLFGGAKRTGNNLGCHKESYAKQDLMVTSLCSTRSSGV